MDKTLDIQILCNQAEECESIKQALTKWGINAAALPLDSFSETTLSQLLPRPVPLIWNRIPARPPRGDRARFELGFQALRQLDKAKLPVVNGLSCHVIGASKWKQAQLLNKVGLTCPKTIPVHSPDELREIPRPRSMLLKPDAGGFGSGMVLLPVGKEDLSKSLVQDAFRPAGRAILQEKILAGDPYVYRVETLGGDILYVLRTPFIEGEFNYCLGNNREAQEWVKVSAIPLEMRDKIKKLCLKAKMELGSLEFIKRQSDLQPVFFDMNPVSTLSPQASNFLGHSPWKNVAAYLQKQIASLAGTS